MTFYLNTTPSTFAEAERSCQISGGHLAAYGSFGEQQVKRLAVRPCDSKLAWCSLSSTHIRNQSCIPEARNWDFLSQSFASSKHHLQQAVVPYPPCQQEVEQWYINNSYMIPTFHKQYWMGYRAKTWGVDNFEVLDATVPMDPDQNSARRYYHWGNFTTVLPNKTVVVSGNWKLSELTRILSVGAELWILCTDGQTACRMAHPPWPCRPFACAGHP